MRLIRNILFLALLVLAVAACGGSSNTSSQTAGTPNLTIEPSTAAIGDEFTLQFSGFQAEEMVTLEIALEETQEVIFQTELQMNSEGSGTFTYRTAEDQVIGAYVATASGEAGQAEVRFEVQPTG
jgi:ABC-type phosphate transport system substrate-binding protein